MPGLFRKLIDDLKRTNPEIQLEHYLIAIQRINVAVIFLDERPYKGEDPQIIFETLNSLGKPLTSVSYTHLKTANNWIKQDSKRPIPKMLFSEFWYEQELCILFADTNVGKTILAVQIADSISRGHPIPGFKLEANAQKVIYCDFELNDKQFQGRYLSLIHI